MRGRRLYRALAEAAVQNSVQLLEDSKVLHRRGNTGHACSLAILAIEEAAKGLVYKLAAEGIVRIVRRKPNNITTFAEGDLLDHRFKHQMVARFFVEAIQFAPFSAALQSTRRKTFTRDQVESLLRQVHTRQVLQSIELQRGGRAAVEAKRVFETLERLNSLKNLGFYVDQARGRVRVPNAAARQELPRVQELSNIVVKALAKGLHAKFTPELRRELTEQTRAIAAGMAKSRHSSKPSRPPE